MNPTKKKAALELQLTDEIKKDLMDDIDKAQTISHHWEGQLDGTDLLQTYYPEAAKVGTTPLMADVLTLHLTYWLNNEGICYAQPRMMKYRTRISISGYPVNEVVDSAWLTDWFAQRNQYILDDLSTAKAIAERILKSEEESEETADDEDNED
ncbi:hypothetical protein [Limosilactobacillus mucosae]|uniref:hypothetical protein n=1 Tax=Limosilactobacillus mucosae TaxID=97478 RepID=UPI0025A4782F|nr:hypothetical protein [Limosilactobacillus mucosae]MDM8220311.1 hypothetical protein [Limosilactobacillus mucosae]